MAKLKVEGVTIHALGSAYFASCREVLVFVGDFVVPKVNDKTLVRVEGRGAARSPRFFQRACHGMVSRIQSWLITLCKLDHPSDFQAILAGSRALFEMAVDLTLIKFEEKGDVGKLMAWHYASKLRLAERRMKRDTNSASAASAFVGSNTQQITELRAKYWGSQKWRSRWTGRNLADDASVADALRMTGFADYYSEHYPVACWNVHGSGVNSMLDTPEEVLPYLAAHGLRDSAHFSLAASRLLLELLDLCDEEAESRLAQLDAAIVAAQSATLELNR